MQALETQSEKFDGSGQQVWKRLWRRLGAHRRPLVLAALASLVAALSASGWASLVGPLAQAVLQEGATGWGPLELSRKDLVAFIPLALVALGSVKALAGWLHSGLMGQVAQRVLGTLRQELYQRLLALDPAWFERRHSGELLSRFTSDVAQVESSVSQALFSLAKDSLQVIALLAVCFSIDWRLFLVVFLVLPGTVIPVTRFSRWAKRAALKSQASVGALSELALESLHTLPVVQSFRLETHALERFDVEQSRYLAAMKRSLFIRGAFSPTTEMLGVLGVAAAISLGAQAVTRDRALSSQVVSFLAAAALLYQPLKGLSHTLQQLSQATGSALRLFAILDAPPRLEAHARAAPLTTSLAVSGLALTWQDGRTALRGVDFLVEAGSTVALVGPSGSGKSSLASVILGFVCPSAGAVLWDGVPLSNLSRQSLREQLAWVPQEPVLLSGTIRDNLLLARPDATEEELWAALKGAHAADFVQAFSRGLQEDVGERGSALSGGQRQRLAIARAFLRQPSVLVLDEPTSALDSHSEAQVQAGLSELMSGRTVLVIAHRMSTVRRAQKIVVLQAGRLAEQGSHGELLRLGGLYARMVEASDGTSLCETSV